jgi:hypothetical protein
MKYLGFILLLAGCSTPIADVTYYTLIPPIPGDTCVIENSVVPSPAPACTVLRGATVDNFLTANQQILDGPGLLAQIAAMNSSGEAAVVISQSAVANLKKEIEDLCSRTKCSYQEKAALAILGKVLKTCEFSRSLVRKQYHENENAN